METNDPICHRVEKLHFCKLAQKHYWYALKIKDDIGLVPKQSKGEKKKVYTVTVTETGFLFCGHQHKSIQITLKNNTFL